MIQYEKISNPLLILLSLVTLLLLYLDPPGGFFNLPVMGGISGKAIEDEGEAKASPSVVKVKITTAAKGDAGTTQNGEQQAAGEYRMPYIEGTPQDPMAYVQLILRRGGTLLLTRGAGFLPVGRVVMTEAGTCSVEDLPAGYLFPNLLGRDVTEHIRHLFGKELPNGATRVLLLWPTAMQDDLQRQLQASPYADSRGLQATYEAKRGKLHVRLRNTLKKGGNWHAIDHTIVL